MDDLGKICDRVIRYSFYFLFFLVPLVVTPFNFELFEFNKMLVVYALTAIIVCAWFTEMVAAKKIIFQRSFWDLPLILFFLSQVVSYLFSIDRHTSFWGYYSRFNGGLLSVISYLLLYWAYVSNMDGRKTLGAMRYVLCSAAIVAAYGIAEHFGIDAQYWVQDVRNRVFSTLGQPNWLAAWLAAIIPLGLAFALRAGKHLLFYSFTLLLSLCLFYTKSRSGIMAALIAFGFFLFLWLSQKKSFTSILTGLAIVLAIAGLIGGKIFWTRNAQDIRYILGLTNEVKIIPQKTNTGGSESTDIRKVVWRGATDIWRHRPLFGTGPETFAYSYYWYRPRGHNDLSEWDFLYNKAHNEYLNYLATTGLVGLLSYLLLILSFIIWVIKIFKSEILNPKQILNSKFQLGQLEIRIIRISLLSGFVSIAVTNFFGFSVVPVSLLFFLFPAFAVATAGRPATAATLPKSLGQRLGILAILMVTGYWLLVIGRYWYADVQFAKAEKLGRSGQYNLAFTAASRAVDLRPFEPGYHDELGLDLAGLAGLAKNENNATLSARLASMATDQSDLALKISPFNLNFWKNRTKIFYRLGETDPEYYQKALDSLLQASELAPTDPKIRYNVALLYAQFGQTETAIKTLEETISLKPNYEDVRYTLALFYEQVGRKDEARQQLEYILSSINPQNQKIKEMLEKR